MALFSHNTEYQIGRGEVAESRLEAPVFVLIMTCAAIALLLSYLYWQNTSITLALAFSLVVFTVSVLRVDWSVYILIVAMLLSPEVSAGAVGVKGRELNVRYEDMLIVTIFLGVALRITWEGRGELFRANPINSGILAYYLVACFSTGLAIKLDLPHFDKKTAFFVLLKMAEFYMIFFLVGNAISTLRQVRKQLVLFFCVALIISAYGIYQVGTVDRISAPFETGGTEPNTLGGYLMIVMCLAAGLYVQAPTRGKRMLFFFLITANFLPFLYTLSRASYLALLVALFTLGIRGRSLVLVCSILLILVLSPFLMPTEVKDRVNYTFQRGSGKEVTIAGRKTGLQVDKSTHERIYVWEKVRYGLKTWPWFGGGVSWDTVMDSQYARVIIETGLFGLAAFVFLQARILKAVNQAYRWSNDWVGKGLSLGTYCATVGLIVHSLGTISFLIVRIMEPFWLIVALAVVARMVAVQEYLARRNRARAPQQEPAEAPPDKPATRPTLPLPPQHPQGRKPFPAT